MIQIRYPRITGVTQEERQKQTENYLRYLIDQLNAQKSTPETTQKQESAIPASQPKIDFSKLFASHIADYWKTIYPVGAIYISDSETNPSTLFGGTWEQIKDTFLMAAGSKYAAGSNGGSDNHNHVYGLKVYEYYNDSAFNPLGKLTGAINIDDGTIGKWTGGSNMMGYETINSSSTTVTKSENVYHYENRANTSTTNNIPPYLAVYVWKRIA